jgi:hypothetical protein
MVQTTHTQHYIVRSPVRNQMLLSFVDLQELAVPSCCVVSCARSHTHEVASSFVVH